MFARRSPALRYLNLMYCHNVTGFVRWMVDHRPQLRHIVPPYCLLHYHQYNNLQMLSCPFCKDWLGKASTPVVRNDTSLPSHATWSCFQLFSFHTCCLGLLYWSCLDISGAWINVQLYVVSRIALLALCNLQLLRLRYPQLAKETPNSLAKFSPFRPWSPPSTGASCSWSPSRFQLLGLGLGFGFGAFVECMP